MNKPGAAFPLEAGDKIAILEMKLSAIELSEIDQILKSDKI